MPTPVSSPDLLEVSCFLSCLVRTEVRTVSSFCFLFWRHGRQRFSCLHDLCVILIDDFPRLSLVASLSRQRNSYWGG